MRFDRLDLNLLVVLDALLMERSVSLAAERVCLSQSATSSALARLRDYFGDDLLVLAGRQMVLTTKGQELIEPVRAVLEQVRATITRPPHFDPSRAERTVRIMASDYVTEVLLAPAINRLLAEAPGLRFEIQPMSEAPSIALEHRLIDLLITLDYAISPDHPSQIVLEDDYVAVGWNGNPAMAGPMTADLYFSSGHVTARFGKTKIAAFEDWFVRKQNQQRRNVVVAPSFMSLPRLVMGSDRLATMHRRQAELFVEYLPLTLRELPFEIPPLREAAQWHVSSSNDPAIRWVVDGIDAAGRDPGGDRASGPGGPSRDELAVQFLHQASETPR